MKGFIKKTAVEIEISPEYTVHLNLEEVLEVIVTEYYTRTKEGSSSSQNTKFITYTELEKLLKNFPLVC